MAHIQGYSSGEILHYTVCSQYLEGCPNLTVVIFLEKEILVLFPPPLNAKFRNEKCFQVVYVEVAHPGSNPEGTRKSVARSKSRPL